MLWLVLVIPVVHVKVPAGIVTVSPSMRAVYLGLNIRSRNRWSYRPLHERKPPQTKRPKRQGTAEDRAPHDRGFLCCVDSPSVTAPPKILPISFYSQKLTCNLPNSNNCAMSREWPYILSLRSYLSGGPNAGGFSSYHSGSAGLGMRIPLNLSKLWTLCDSNGDRLIPSLPGFRFRGKSIFPLCFCRCRPIWLSAGGRLGIGIINRDQINGEINGIQ